MKDWVTFERMKMYICVVHWVKFFWGNLKLDVKL